MKVLMSLSGSDLTGIRNTGYLLVMWWQKPPRGLRILMPVSVGCHWGVALVGTGSDVNALGQRIRTP